MTDQTFQFGTRCRRRRGGAFGDTECLIPLFEDPDARGPRKWRDMFDRTRCDKIDPRDIIRQLPTPF